MYWATPKLGSVKTEVNSLPEATEALREVTEFLTRLSASLGVPIKTGTTVQPPSANGKMPQGMSERIIKILTDAGRPMMPREIVNRHQELGWTAPEGGRSKLYEAVSGSLSYLFNRKEVLTRGKKGYSIRSDEKE